MAKVRMAPTGPAPRADADDERHDKRQEREFEGGGAVTGKNGDDLLVVGQRGAEVTVQQAVEIIDVLYDQWTVIAGRVDALLQFLRRQAAA